MYMDAGMEVHPWSWVYFVSFILIAAFVVINVLIGIVLNSMEEAREAERRKRGARAARRRAPERRRPGRERARSSSGSGSSAPRSTSSRPSCRRVGAARAKREA